METWGVYLGLTRSPSITAQYLGWLVGWLVGCGEVTFVAMGGMYIKCPTLRIFPYS